jgi:hypothetical protein
MPGWVNCASSIFFGNNAKKFSYFAVVLRLKAEHNFCMKTRFGLPRLAGWMGRCGVALIALAFCASAFADPSKNVVVPTKASATKAQTEAQQAAFKRQVYIFISSSGIPQPIERVAGHIPTTVVPMFIAGNHAAGE